MQELHVEMHLLATTSPGAWQRLADTTGREIVRATSKTLNDIMTATPSQAHTDIPSAATPLQPHAGAGAGGRGAEGSAEASPLDAAENTAPRFPAKNMEGEAEKAEKAEPRRPTTAATALGELRAGALMLAESLAEAASGTTSPASNTCSLAVGRRVAQAQVYVYVYVYVYIDIYIYICLAVGRRVAQAQVCLHAHAL